VKTGDTSQSGLSKVIIYPKPGDTIDGLKQCGARTVDNYGSYWVAAVADLTGAKAKYGDRLQVARYLDQISLRDFTIDTTKPQPQVPVGLREAATEGRRLRLVQFRGPVLPEWLTALQAIPGMEVVQYVPYNGYLIFADAAAEKKVAALPAAQWVGIYHPYYKFDHMVRWRHDFHDFNVTVVNTPEGEAALERIGSKAEMAGQRRTSFGETVMKFRTDVSKLPEIARMPEVVWIEPVFPIQMMDEVQAEIVSSHTNNTTLGTGGPIPPADPGGQTYLAFLTNAVGGTAYAAFTNAATYPIVDIADSGFTDNPLNTDFYPLGSSAEGFQRYRVSYAVNDVSCGVYSFQRSTYGTNNAVCIPNYRLAGGDYASIPHGTAIASIIAGYNTSPSARDPSGFQLGMGVSPFGLVGATRVFQPDLDIVDAQTCSYNIYDTFCVNNFPQLIQNEYFLGGRIANSSWGEGLVVGANDGLYNSTCQTYDIGVRDAILTGAGGVSETFPLNQELIIVFANGNFGSQGNNGGFADITVTPPGTAKNVISVGSTENVRLDGSGCLFMVDQDNSYNIASYSSFGPTRDGRFKPEIVAPGGPVYAVGAAFWTNYVSEASGLISVGRPPGNLYSYDLNPDYFCTFNRDITTRATGTDIRGSSYSAPSVSGGIQLLWWYFQHRLSMLEPTPAMAKAYLCNSARYLPITNTLSGALDTLPSIAQGMGILDLKRMFDGVGRIIRDESTPRALQTPLITTNIVVQQTYFSQSGQSYELSGQIASNGLPFRVTLAWTDAPGSPNVSPELVNNLDLQVTIGGIQYKGNVFVGPNSAVGISGDVPDSVNPMESVFLPAGGAVTSGAPWKVLVKATNIPGDGVPNVGNKTDQDFALVVYNAKTETNLVSDIANPNTNDACQTAAVIPSFPYSATVSNFPSTVFHNNQPSPSAGVGGADVFWRIVAPTAGAAISADTSGSTFNTLLSVWRGTCGALLEEVSNDDVSNSLTSAVAFTANGVDDYYIVVDNVNNSTGTLQLHVNAQAAPVTFSVANLDFGGVVVGTTSTVQSATLINGTTQPLNITSTLLAGADAGEFVVVNESCAGSSLPPGATCTVLLQFAPTNTGSRTAQFLVNDSAIGTPRILPLSGVGLPPAPLACIDTSGLTFSNQLVGTTSPTKSIIVTNCGSLALSITNITITGAGSASFNIAVPGCGAPLSAGNTCTIGVSFTPTGGGLQSAQLKLYSNAGNSPQTIPLSGTGVQPVPSICASAYSLDFGTVTVGTTSDVSSVTITNCGTAALNITKVLLTGANTNDFRITGNTCSSVATGATCAVSLEFIASDGGTRTATLIISNNANSAQAITLKGTGNLTQPDLLINKKSSMKKALGNGVINNTGDGQTLAQTVRRGKSRVFYIAVKNAGSSADSFTVTGDGNLANQLSVSYFVGAKNYNKITNDVTSAVVAGTYATSTLAAGAITGDSTLLRLQVTALPTALSGTNNLVITASSPQNPSKADTVRARVIIK
jgi:hypothetical protein